MIASVFVDMAEHVKPRLNFFDPGEQVVAARSGTQHGSVANSTGRAVGDEHIQVVGDTIPMLANLRAAFAVEGEAVELGCHGRAPYPTVLDLDQLVLQVVNAVFLGERAHSLRIAFATVIVVASDDHPMTSRLSPHPVHRALDLVPSAVHCQIASVDE